MIRYTLRLFGRLVGELEIEDDTAEEEAPTFGGGSGHNFERAEPYDVDDGYYEEDFGFHASK